MPERFFILLQLFLRVDDVLVRAIETRIYHEFGSAEVLRDVQHVASTLVCA